MVFDKDSRKMHAGFSDSVGRKGGKQIINLQFTGVDRKIVHEIGYGIIFCSKVDQSRPDCDSFVAINLQSTQNEAVL